MNTISPLWPTLYPQRIPLKFQSYLFTVASAMCGYVTFHWGHKNQELDWISLFSVKWNGGSMIREDLFSHSLEEAMNEIRIKIQEAGAYECFQSPGKQF